MSAFLERDVAASWQWLSHSITELGAIHKDYQPGREHYEHNKRNNAFPKVAYAATQDQVLTFVRQYHGTHMVLYGVNERPTALKNERGYPRAAREEEIPSTKSFFLDIDIKAKQASQAHVAAAEKFLCEADDYFQDLGLRKPVRAFTGRGYHLLFAYPTIRVGEFPDVAERQRKFADDFRDSYHKELAGLEAQIDATHDLRRMAKIYGTAKPQVGIVSRFYGGERVEDAELRTYLLSMNLPDAVPTNGACDPAYGPKLVSVGNDLPALFRSLLKRDELLRELWEGNGKQNGDTSRSGYDFSLTRRLLSLGYRNLDDIATVLSLRPDGAVRASGKDLHYVCRTIGNAIGS